MSSVISSTLEGTFNLGNKSFMLSDLESTGHGVDLKLWDRLVRRILKNLEFKQAFGAQDDATQKVWAEVLLDQAIGFLLFCGKDAKHVHAPSRLVDIAWHEFMLYSMQYEQFCMATAGFFIHHVPDDEDPVSTSGLGYVEQTMMQMSKLGISTIPEAWPGTAECHVVCRGNCKDVGDDGK